MSLTLDEALALKAGDKLHFDNGTDEVYTVVSTEPDGKGIRLILQRQSDKEWTHAGTHDLPKAELVKHAPKPKAEPEPAAEEPEKVDGKSKTPVHHSSNSKSKG